MLSVRPTPLEKGNLEEQERKADKLREKLLEARVARRGAGRGRSQRCRMVGPLLTNRSRFPQEKVHQAGYDVH